jgi:hypothetical protein
MFVSREVYLALLRVSGIIGVICVSAGLFLQAEITDPKIANWKPWITLGILILSLIVSVVVPDLIFQSLSKWHLYRRWLMGETWIEGSWLAETTRGTKPDQPGASNNVRIGIVTHNYQGQYLSLRTWGHHIEFIPVPAGSPNSPDGSTLQARGRLWHESEAIRASSRIAIVDALGTYINVFHYDGKSGDGTASGWFTMSNESKWPEEFTATIVTQDREILYQWGRKLDNKIVRGLRKRYSTDWEDVLIRHRFTHGEAWRANLSAIL